MANKSLLKRFCCFDTDLYVFLKIDSLNRIYEREIFCYFKNFELLYLKFSKTTFWKDNNFNKNKNCYVENSVL